MSHGDPFGAVLRRCHTASKYLVGAVAVFVPLVLLALPGRAFNGDWDIHNWMIAYHGEYFRHHHHFPTCLHTDQHPGIASPVFYGNVWFKVAGLLGSLVSYDNAFPLAALVLSCAQYVSVRTLFRRLR